MNIDASMVKRLLSQHGVSYAGGHSFLMNVPMLVDIIRAAASAPAIADTAGAKPVTTDAQIEKLYWKVNHIGLAEFAAEIRALLASPAIDAAGASSDDVRDAARYRKVRQNAYIFGVGNPSAFTLDQIVDAAIKTESGK